MLSPIRQHSLISHPRQWQLTICQRCGAGVGLTPFLEGPQGLKLLLRINTHYWNLPNPRNRLKGEQPSLRFPGRSDKSDHFPMTENRIGSKSDGTLDLRALQLGAK